MNKRASCGAWAWVIACVCLITALLAGTHARADDYRLRRDFDDDFRRDPDFELDERRELEFRRRREFDDFRRDRDFDRFDRFGIGGFPLFMAALDVEFASGTGLPWLQRGAGATLRLGSELRSEFVTFVPELTLGYHGFNCLVFSDARVFTGQIGARVRFFRFIEPGVYAHLGLGTIWGDEHFAHTGVAFDAGATLDLTVIRIRRIQINIGFHLSWNRIFGGLGNGFSFVLTGAHIEFGF